MVEPNILCAPKILPKPPIRRIGRSLKQCGRELDSLVGNAIDGPALPPRQLFHSLHNGLVFGLGQRHLNSSSRSDGALVPTFVALTFLAFRNEVNAMTLAYAAKLGLLTQKIDVGVRKIDDSALVTHWMVIAGFSLQDKLGRVRFFEETFLWDDTSMEVVLGLPFLTLSDANIRFAGKELVWRSYTAAKALPTIQRVELIDINTEGTYITFIVHCPTEPPRRS
ncbi:hypothetical protein MMC31_005267 [Peltigera leucophlebia]|nr:hypothetical protein [Peltigera leucophlebia]